MCVCVSAYVCRTCMDSVSVAAAAAAPSEPANAERIFSRRWAGGDDAADAGEGLRALSGIDIAFCAVTMRARRMATVEGAAVAPAITMLCARVHGCATTDCYIRAARRSSHGKHLVVIPHCGVCALPRYRAVAALACSCGGGPTCSQPADHANQRALSAQHGARHGERVWRGRRELFIPCAPHMRRLTAAAAVPLHCTEHTRAHCTRP